MAAALPSRRAGTRGRAARTLAPPTRLIQLCVPAYRLRSRLARDLGLHRDVGNGFPPVGAASPIGPALEEPSPAPLRTYTPVVSRIGENQVAATRWAAVLTRTPPKQRRDRRRTAVDASQIHSHAGQGTPLFARPQGGVTVFFQGSKPKSQQTERAGQPGLEPGIAGFGDRCLANLATAPRSEIVAASA